MLDEDALGPTLGELMVLIPLKEMMWSWGLGTLGDGPKACERLGTHLYGGVKALGHLDTLACILWVDMVMMMPYDTYALVLRSCAYPQLLIFVPMNK